ncbi:MAG: lipoyl synthase [Myxococcales bacterium]|nr:lipoyl synthase [Myxococcales bacterium]USN51687.1 MAG: lipoyl synthase [Myxococcales bacterium]
MSTCTTTQSLERPSWLRVRAPTGERYQELSRLLVKERLNTVCSSAACPNIGECWNIGTATFMILGNQCTRACRFCNVQSKLRPGPVDLNEPERLLKSAIAMNLKHVVITSVSRDDLADGGAQQFARCLKLLREHAPHMSTEVLVPDFLGNKECLKIVIDEKPNIFNHNLETIRRLTPKIRSGAQYDRSLLLLKTAKELDPTIQTKSGIMLGLGENIDEVKVTLQDLKAHNCDQLTIGQYLRPTQWHHPLDRYASPEEFTYLANFARDLGFSHVESGPLVRSSYHAERGVK